MYQVLEQTAGGKLSAEEASKQIHAVYDVTNKAQKKSFLKNVVKKQRFEYITEYHTVKEIYMKLSHTELGVFYKLFLCLQFGKDGLLVAGGNTMKISDMIKVSGLAERQLSKVLKRLEEHSLLIKDGAKKGQVYVINPSYVNIGGTKGSKTPFTKMYKITGRYIQDKLTTRELGFLLKLSLFIDYNTLIVAVNPYEKNPEKVVPLGIKEISQLMGESDQTTKTYIKALGKAGILYEDGPAGSPITKKLFYIHPQLVLRGKGEGDVYGQVLSYFTDLHQQKKLDEDYELKTKTREFLDRVAKHKQTPGRRAE